MTATRVASPASPGKSLRILLVEDSEDVLFLMKTELEGMGHTVITAENGDQGLTAAQTNAPDLLISDIRMPLKDGYELIRSLRSASTLSAIPAIAMTGFQAKADVRRALDAGFDACVNKAAAPAELAVLIHQLTNKERRNDGGDHR
jgi:two-component system, chemotaxis family, CheB/CheR fusion protein